MKKATRAIRVIKATRVTPVRTAAVRDIFTRGKLSEDSTEQTTVVVNISVYEK